MSVFDSFIPIPSGQMQFLFGSELLSDTVGTRAYEVVGNEVIYKGDLTLEGITKVRMQLIVMDVDRLTDYDPLPIPADMEDTVVRKVFELMQAQMPTDKIVDSAVDKAQ